MRRAAAVLAAAVALGGCAVLAPPQTSALLAAGAMPAGLPDRVEHTGAPFFPQTPYHCGPAALATALGHAGLRVAPDALARAVFLPSRQGSLQTEMLAAARRAGAAAYRLPGELQALLQEVAAGQAVIVLQNLGLAIAPRWHYAVVIGYDLPQRELILRSGVTRRERMSLATFEHTWARGGHWAIVPLPPGRLPVTVTRAGAVEAALGFERVASPADAASTYRALLARWPDEPVAGMGLGNVLLAGGDEAAAAAAFERVARAHDHAAAWNNLAQVQLRRGRLDDALQAAEQAVRLATGEQARWAVNAQATLDEARRRQRLAAR